MAAIALIVNLLGLPFYGLPVAVVLLFVAISLSTAGIAARWSWVRDERRFRVNTFRCIKCGYNLVGNTSGVCPECGAAISQKIPDVHKIPPPI